MACKTSQRLKYPGSAPLTRLHRFRWAQLWLGVFFNPNHDSVVLKKTAREMLENLEQGVSLPAASEGHDLAQVYQQLWDINGDGDKSRKLHQTRLFRFVLAAERPLHKNALLDALRFDLETPKEYAKEINLAYLQKLHHNFLRERNGILKFEHISAKTFVLQMQESDNKHFLFADQIRNHHTIAETSLLLFKNPGHELWKEAGIQLSSATNTLDFTNESSLNRWLYTVVPNRDMAHGTRLANYVLSSWLQHCRKLNDHDMDEELRWQLLETLIDLPVLFRCGDGTADRWNDISCTTEAFTGPPVVNPLILALILGISPFHHPSGKVEVHPYFGDIMTRNTDEETALHVAVRLNDHRSVRALLEINSQADPNVPLLFSVDSEARNLLHVVQDLEMVKILLDFEAEWANIANPSPKKLRSSYLLQGMDKEYNTPTNNLLEHLDDDSMIWIMERFESSYYGVTEAFGCPVWHVAVRRGLKRVIRLLLDRGASIEAVDSTDGTALEVAAASGDEDMARFLIEHGADVNSPGGEYGTPLGTALHYKKENVFKVLLEHDIDFRRAVRLSSPSDYAKWKALADQSNGFAKILRQHGHRYFDLDTDQ